MYLGLHGVVGLILSAACIWIFFAIAEDLPENGALVHSDLAVTNWLQTHGTEGGESLFVGVSYLKAVFHRSRPTFASEFHMTSWSFPSGHAMNSIVLYGLLAYWVAQSYPGAKVWMLLGLTILVAAIGYSRIYLGVHYLSDVLAGLSAGLTWLVVCITGHRFAERRSVLATP